MTTRTLTPAQTTEALELLRKFSDPLTFAQSRTFSEGWYCSYCHKSSVDIALIKHAYFCPVPPAQALLAAIESEAE